jgi:ABC-2 type transport system ATP-binding protein
MNDAIEVNELTVTYGDAVAVDRLSLVVGFGEVLGLLGPNGAGKTSTLETIEGYRRPSGGTVRVLGIDPAAKQAQLARQMGVMLQEGGIPSRMTTKAALGLYAKFYDDPEPIDTLVERLDLHRVLKTPYRRLSGGEKQRLSLALALIGRPRVLLLDEPTAGVDPEGKAAIRELIAELRASSVAILMTGHELEEIDRMVDRVLVIDRGTQRALGSPAELRQRFGGEGIEFSAKGALDLAQLASRLGVAVRAVRPDRYRVEAEATTELLGRLVEVLGELGIEANEVATVTASLEEIYLSLIGSATQTEANDPQVASRGHASAPPPSATQGVVSKAGGSGANDLEPTSRRDDHG